MIEVVRGCANLCRFCWAGYNYLPVRAFPADRILAIAEAARSHATRVGRALLRLSARNGRIRARRMEFDGIDLMSASARQMRDIRGARISMIMQDPRYSLNPVVTVGEHRHGSPPDAPRAGAHPAGRRR